MIKRLYILNKEGRQIFFHEFDKVRVATKKLPTMKPHDPQLMMHFFSAIMQFAELNDGKEINCIKLQGDQFLFRREKRMYFVFQCDKTCDILPEARLDTIMNKTVMEFFLKYNPATIQLGTDGQVNVDFSGFADKVRAIISSQVRRGFLEKKAVT